MQDFRTCSIDSIVFELTSLNLLRCNHTEEMQIKLLHAMELQTAERMDVPVPTNESSSCSHLFNCLIDGDIMHLGSRVVCGVGRVADAENRKANFLEMKIPGGEAGYLKIRLKPRGRIGRQPIGTRYKN